MFGSHYSINSAYLLKVVLATGFKPAFAVVDFARVLYCCPNQFGRHQQNAILNICDSLK